jgi:hypothetical protein
MAQIIYTVTASLASFALLRVAEYFIKERRERRRQTEEIEKLHQEMRRFEMLALKCVITNKELSKQARLDAYDEYKHLGGNSWVDGYVLKYLSILEN